MEIKNLDFFEIMYIITMINFRAEVAELVDASDLKSDGLLARAGSSPALGIINDWEHIAG